MIEVFEQLKAEATIDKRVKYQGAPYSELAAVLERVIEDSKEEEDKPVKTEL